MCSTYLVHLKTTFCFISDYFIVAREDVEFNEKLDRAMHGLWFDMGQTHARS
jgi:hypothetical protein